MPVEHTFALIKNQAFRRGLAPQITEIAERAGLAVVAVKSYGTDIFQTDRALFEELYKEHKNRPYYDNLMLSTAPMSKALVLKGEDAIMLWRSLLGPTDPAKARKENPESIRALFGGDEYHHNAAHGSDSPESAAREIKLFFPKLELSTS